MGFPLENKILFQPQSCHQLYLYHNLLRLPNKLCQFRKQQVTKNLLENPIQTFYSLTHTVRSETDFVPFVNRQVKNFFSTLFWYQTLFCGVFHEWNEWKIQLFQSNSLYRMNFLFKCYGNAFGTNISIDFGKLMYVSHSYIIHCSNS